MKCQKCECFMAIVKYYNKGDHTEYHWKCDKCGHREVTKTDM